jgi:hypothetical protein
VTTCEARNTGLLLCDEIGSALNNLRILNRRSFDGALVNAIEVASDLRRGFADGRDRYAAFTLQAMAATTEIESCLAQLDGIHDDEGELDRAMRKLRQLRSMYVHAWPLDADGRGTATQRAKVSRRTRCATGVAVRLLPPADRERYREEFAAELADLPRADQAPYAIRLAWRALSLRRSLVGKGGVVVAAGAGGCVCLAVMGWPAAVLGGMALIAVMWTVNSQDRTRRLATLIRAARSRPASARRR